MSKLEGLYLITDEMLTPYSSLLEEAQEVLKAGVKIIQLRDKHNTDEFIEPYADKLQELCNSYDALFVLNDRVELAVKKRYSGLHVGKSDYENIEYIRKNFSGILGVSCYRDVAKAKEFEQKGVDYVAFGSFFHSPTKPDSKVVPLETLQQAKKELKIPVCAIGGVNLENINLLQEADMFAIISDVWSFEDRKKRVKKYIKLLNTKEIL